MKNALTLSLVFIFFTIFIKPVFSQKIQTLPKVQYKNSFYAGIYVAPSLIVRPHYRYFHGGGWNTKYIAGLQTGFNYKGRISIQAGLEYFKDEYITKNNFQLRRLPSGNDFEANYQVNYFQVPVLIKTFISKREKSLRWYLPVGFVYRIEKVDETLFEFNDDRSSFVNVTKATYSAEFISCHLGVGSNYRLTDKLSLFAEANGRSRIWYNNSLERDKWLRYGGDGVDFSFTVGVNYQFKLK
jgi:hypothetical protein